MKNFSNINLKTSKEQAINVACSKTGLDLNVISKLYESQITFGKTDTEIVSYFDSLTLTKENYTSKEFISEIIKIVTDLTLKDDKKHDFTKFFIKILSDFESEKKLDTINLLDVINEILIIKNPEAKNKLLPLMELNFTEEVGTVLNESFNFIVDTNLNQTNDVMLFEGLKEILNKNNKRWGVTYHIKNSYNAIMEYLDNEIVELQFKQKYQTTDNDYHLMILNDMLSGSVSPLYRNISSVKTLIVDSQTLVFDMILLIERFIKSNDRALDFVNKQTYNEYKVAGNETLKLIISSLKSSKILSESTKSNLLGVKSSRPLSNNENEPICYDLTYIKNLLDISNEIDSKDLNYNTWNISLKSVIDMVNFIKSCSGEFNLKIRPTLRAYINKSYELSASVEKAQILLAKTLRY